MEKMRIKVRNEKWKKVRIYLSTAFVICTLFLILCAIKRIFPFGSNTIDTVDFGSQWVPGYYHVWDFLHGKGSLLFDWKVAGGNNFAGAASQFSLISPFNLLLLLVKRDQIQRFMTFFILIKLVVMGLSMCFFLQKCREKKGGRLYIEEMLMIVAGSTAYALSGYTFQYYGMGWPDVAAIFPILIYYLMEMEEKERGWKPGKHTVGYVCCLTLIFIINIPQAYMTCFFLIFFAGGYFFLLRKEQKINKEGILKFGLTSLLSLGLSAIVFLPAAIGMLNSFRLSGEEYTGESGYFWLLRQQGMDPQAKWMMLLGVSIPFVYLIVTTRKTRECLWQSYLVILMVLPVAVEAVNLMWHKGTYMCFPMRHGYMMIFAVIVMAFERYMERRILQADCRRSIYIGVVLTTWCALTLGLGIMLMSTNLHGREVDFVRDAEEIREVLAEKSDVFHKVKIADASLDSNYPLIAGVSSYSNYLHLMTEEQITLQRALGYSQIWTRMSDTGGTLFSDALLGYEYTVINRQSGLAEQMDEELYEIYGETEHFTVFRNNYVYETPLRLELDAYRKQDWNISGNVFENQNKLSKALFGEDFFTVWTETFADEKASETLTYRIPVEKEGILYLYSKELSGAEIFVNGKKLPVPGYTDLQGTTYLSDCNNGILTLGYFKGEEVTVEIHQTCYDTGIPKQIQFGILDMEAFTSSVAESREAAVSYELGKSICKITATAEQEEFLVLPVNADGGWKCNINGSEEGIATLYGNLMMVQLKPGENEILLVYIPRGLKKGAAVTILAVVVLALWAALARIKKADNVIGKIYHGLSYGALVVFMLVFAGCLLVVYVVPMVYSLYLKLFGGIG
ncbi:MAG: YfhO family protein [Clostridiales bacterium]|nr:YfhO family protein [Clostridiales bacterium]